MFMFIAMYIAFIVLILAFSNFSSKIRSVYANPSLLAIIAFGLSLISLTVFLIYPFYSLIGGIVALVLGVLGILQVYLYAEITRGYAPSLLAIITGITIVLMYYLGV